VRHGTERTPHPCELFGDDWYEWAHREEETQKPSFQDVSGNVSDDCSVKGGCVPVNLAAH